MTRYSFALLLLIPTGARVWGGETPSRNSRVTTSAVLLGLGDRRGQVLYRFIEPWIIDMVRWKSCLVQPAGSLATEDERFLYNGIFREYRYARWTPGQRSEAWVDGNNVVFGQQTPGGKRRERKEPVVDHGKEIKAKPLAQG
ncbi:MAG: hypothetical protein AB1898_32140 [Acidobacteriota bacterium]